MGFDFDIAIVGGGLNGPALAIALADLGCDVVLIDALGSKPRKKAGFDGRAYAIALTSARMLNGIGIWQDVKQYAQPMLDIKVTDGRAGEGASPFFMHFDHAEIEEGPMGYMLEDRHLRRSLLDTAEAHPKIQIKNKRRVHAQIVDETGITLSMDKGPSLRAHLAIGADGRGSGTAQRADIKRISWAYDQTALVCAVTHEKPHFGVAHQFFMPAGPLAILPLTGNRSQVVWSEQAATAAAVNELDDPAYLDILRPRFGDFLGQLSLAGTRYTYPLGLSLTHDMIADRVALVGDAAHGVHPIAGQGLNAGMRDVAALAHVIGEAKQRGEDIGAASVLEQYQRWRRFDNATLAVATDSFNRLFSNDNALIRVARGIGMGAVANLSGLRRGFIREASGLNGDLPKLMQMPL
ncbi:MAG: FAD-dependent monooxygenase [Pseudomonadota bacterium]